MDTKKCIVCSNVQVHNINVILYIRTLLTTSDNFGVKSNVQHLNTHLNTNMVIIANTSVDLHSFNHVCRLRECVIVNVFDSASV